MSIFINFLKIKMGNLCFKKKNEEKYESKDDKNSQENVNKASVRD